MGWALKRPDGTYRAWNRNAQDDIPELGEVWEELDTMPPITVPPGPPTKRGLTIAALKAAPTATVALLLQWLKDIYEQE